MKVLDLLSPSFLGKKVKYLASHKQVTQEHLVKKKKTSGVTESQFESGDEKYFSWITRSKIIGSHRIYETSKIVSLIASNYDMEGYDISLMLENGKKLCLDIFGELEMLDDETFVMYLK